MEELIQKIIRQKKFIIICVSISLMLGLAIFVTSPSEYNSEGSFINTSSEKELDPSSLIGGLDVIGDFGLNLGSNSLFSPEIYPTLIRSTPFILDLLKEEFYFEELGDTLSLDNYFLEVYKPNFIKRTLKLLFSSDDGQEIVGTDSTTIFISKEYYKVVEDIKERIEVSIDSETGLIYINSKMPDGRVSAEVCKIIIIKLSHYINYLKLGEAKKKLAYLKQQERVLRNKYDDMKTSYSEFLNENRNLFDKRSMLEEKYIESEYNLSFDMLKNTINQIESLELDIADKTSVLRVIDPPLVPIDESSPSLVITIILSMIIGTTFPVVYILRMDFWRFLISL